MYTINLSTGVVIDTINNVQVAPCQSVDDPMYQEYVAWVNAGNQPTEVQDAVDPAEKILKIILAAQEFGKQLSLEFLVENNMLGITKAGMVEKVREVLDMPFRAVETGSLVEAITRIKAIPEEQRYPIFVSEERMLKYVNKIEAYLGKPLSTSV